MNRAPSHLHTAACPGSAEQQDAHLHPSKTIVPILSRCWNTTKTVSYISMFADLFAEPRTMSLTTAVPRQSEKDSATLPLSAMHLFNAATRTIPWIQRNDHVRLAYFTLYGFGSCCSTARYCVYLQQWRRTYAGSQPSPPIKKVYATLLLNFFSPSRGHIFDSYLNVFIKHILRAFRFLYPRSPTLSDAGVTSFITVSGIQFCCNSLLELVSYIIVSQCLNLPISTPVVLVVRCMPTSNPTSLTLLHT